MRGAPSFLVYLLALVLLCLAMQGAYPAPPPGTDPNGPTAKWVQQLKTPEGWSCCSVADCRPVDVRLVQDGGWQAFIDRARFGDTAPDGWVDVPDNIVRYTQKPGPSPNGTAWACWFAGAVRCLTVEGGF